MTFTLFAKKNRLFLVSRIFAIFTTKIWSKQKSLKILLILYLRSNKIIQSEKKKQFSSGHGATKSPHVFGHEKNMNFIVTRTSSGIFDLKANGQKFRVLRFKIFQKLYFYLEFF